MIRKVGGPAVAASTRRRGGWEPLDVGGLSGHIRLARVSLAHSTYVGGSLALIEELLANDGLEVAPATIDGDRRVN